MQFPHHALIGAAVNIPIPDPTPVISYSPVVLPAPGRPVDLQLRVVFPPPPAGDDAASSSPHPRPLPIILLAHGAGPSNWLSSLDGYAPLAEFYASHGFAVLQPTLPDSRFLNLPRPAATEADDDPDYFWWQTRARDFGRVLDALDAIEDAVPGLRRGQLDRARVAVVGHSYGGTTASMLLGAANTDPRTNAATATDLRDARVRAGVVLAGTGTGAGLSAAGRALLPFYGPDFGAMRAPALVVCGDEDTSPMAAAGRGAGWHADPYALAPGPKSLLTLRGARHALGGVSGFDTAEAEDESPERLGAVQRMTWAYLWSQLHEGDTAWEEASRAFEGLGQLGTLEHK
ncbi:hypothetical protein SLS62_001756 [Diatrype stigma]|uniref:1-alkyl-2-acetylglycerophosphocholine esterase n=1 Tax=Diatrype stigma TaxID=117547 RepID=A0AAN9V7U7_9PEZI